MIRAVGASKYGVIVYIGAIIAIFESVADFGVSSAAGKAIATARESGVAPLGAVIKKWARLQTITAIGGLLPLLIASYFAASAGSHMKFGLGVLILLVSAAWITIFFNFVQACLTSMLAFKSLAALNTFDSIVRSASWLAVAFFMPTTFGLALASLVNAGCSSAVGIVILRRLASRHKIPDVAANAGLPGGLGAVHLGSRDMLKESLGFLWLRLSTRAYQSVPSLIFARMFGAEVVGVVGSVGNIINMIGFPFGVIGNALAVRAPGVVSKGDAAATALWDAASRFIAVSLMLAATVYLSAEFMAHLLLPSSHDAPVLTAILSMTVFTTGISSVVAPMSDYVGGLQSRNILLTVFAFVQIPIILFGGYVFGAKGALIAYVLAHVLKNFGYVIIALKVFFRGARYRLRPEIGYFLVITSMALLFARILGGMADADHLFMLRFMNVAFVKVAFFWFIAFAGLFLHQASKKFFLTKSFFDFQT